MTDQRMVQKIFSGVFHKSKPYPIPQTRGRGSRYKRDFSWQYNGVLNMPLPSIPTVSILQRICRLFCMVWKKIRAHSSLEPVTWTSLRFRGKAVSDTGFQISGSGGKPVSGCPTPSQVTGCIQLRGGNP